MMHLIVLRMVVCLLALFLYCAPFAEARRRGHNVTRSVEFGGKTRHYVVYEPKAAVGKKFRLS